MSPVGSRRAPIASAILMKARLKSYVAPFALYSFLTELRLHNVPRLVGASLPGAREGDAGASSVRGERVVRDTRYPTPGLVNPAGGQIGGGRMDGVRPVPPELEVTSAELQHIKANVYDHCVVCLPSAYARAVPGLNLNVSGGYHADRTDTRVSDERTLWVGRLGELGAALGKFKEEEKKEESTSETEPSTGETTESTKRVGDGVAALLALSELELLEPTDTGSHATPSEKDEISPTPKPAVVFVSGSSGVAGDTLRYLRMIASEGHLVLCPDDFCGWPKRLRHRTPKAIKQWVEVDGEDKQTDDDKKQSQPSSDYWSLNLLYSANETPTGELVYESCAEQYTSSDRLAMVYDTTLAVKHLALTKLLLDLPKSIATRGIYLAGNSEGAIVLGMMDDSMLDAPVNGGSRRRSVGDLIASAGTGTSAFAGLLQGLSGLRLLTGDTAWEAKLLGTFFIP